MKVPLLFLGVLATQTLALNFTVAGGQIYTPGLAIIDAPQPGTPLGGELLEVAIEVSGNGRFPLSDKLADDSPTRFHNITVFLYSYDTGRNFTISNGTVNGTINGTDFKDGKNGNLPPVMLQEPGSTVKHVKWRWPDCLVGDGQPKDAASPRGVYNISIRQSFRMNGTDYYTIFDMPISVTNRIDNDGFRASCDSLTNPLLRPDEINMNDTSRLGVMFAPGDSRQVEVKGNGSDKDGSGTNPGAGTGLGEGGAGILSWSRGALWMCLLTLALVFIL